MRELTTSDQKVLFIPLSDLDIPEGYEVMSAKSDLLHTMTYIPHDDGTWSHKSTDKEAGIMLTVRKTNLVSEPTLGAGYICDNRGTRL